MEFTFGGKYKLDEEIGFGGCGKFMFFFGLSLLFRAFLLSIRLFSRFPQLHMSRMDKKMSDKALFRL